MAKNKKTTSANVSVEQRVIPQCEGMVRRSGVFSLGKADWKQCENKSTMMLTFNQGNGKETMPCCDTCLKRCIDFGIKIIARKALSV
jgi:hypothetical protein